MPTGHSNRPNYTWRRCQLEIIPKNKLDALVDPAIATAISILNNIPNPSDTLRGTAYKYLKNAMGSVAGYNGAPLRKMNALLRQLCPDIPYKVPFYPSLPLSPKTIDEEYKDFADQALQALPYLRTYQAKALARRLLATMHKLGNPFLPHNLKKHRDIFLKFDPTFTDDTGLIPPITSKETLDRPRHLDNADPKTLQRALALLKAKPQGSA
jgi:hypothetical protein